MDNYKMGQDGFIWFVGVVEDRNDPSKLGRVKVRCLGFHTEDLNKIPTDDLPWAHVMHSVTDPSMQGMGSTPSFLVEGAYVIGFFRDAAEKQQPVIMGSLPGYPQTVANTEKGFNDPNGVFPKNPANYGHDLKESDVNRLARNDTDQAHTVVTTKDSTRTEKVAVANSTTTWDEPKSAYASVYPNNHVYETESGHIKEFDDSVGTERIHEYHRKGTFYEIDAMGNKATRVVGDNYEIIAGSDYVNVKGSANLTVSETLNIKSKNLNIEAETVTEKYTTKTETATTGNITYTGGDVNASNISLLGHQHKDNAGLAAAATSVPLGGTSAESLTIIDGSAIDGSTTTVVPSEVTNTGTTGSITTDDLPSDLNLAGTTTVDDLTASDDITLKSDSAVLGFGSDSDTTLTHVADTALLLNSSRQLQFGDSGTYIHQSAAGVLDLVSDTEIEINATTIDMNGALDVSGDIDVGGNIELGHASDTTISRSASGTVQIEGNTIITTANADTPATVSSSSEVDHVLVNDGGVLKKSTVSNLGVAGTPSGVLVPFGGTSAPSGWLFCFGQAVSRTTYADLFSAISTTYGSGDGSSTFNLPDLRGRVVAGQDDMGGSSANRLTSPINGDTLGATGGDESVSVSASGSSNSHSHTISTHGATGNQLSTSSVSLTFLENLSTTANVLQPTIVLNYIIKT